MIGRRVVRTRPLLAALLALALMLLVAACGGGSSSGGGDDDKEIVIGVEAPLSGADADSGKGIWNGIEMAFKEAGNKVGPYTVKLVRIDDKADPAGAVANYTHAITGDHVDAVLSNWNTDVSLAVMDVSARYRI